MGSKAMVPTSKARIAAPCDGTSWDYGLVQGRR